MIGEEKNRISDTDVKGIKLFSVISLYLAVSWFLSLILYKSNKPGILADYTLSWLVLLCVAIVVLGAVGYFNCFIWVRAGRYKNGGAKENQGWWASWFFTLLMIVLVWLVVFGLTWFHGNLNEKGIVNFDDQVIVLGLACSLTLITFMKIPPLSQVRVLSKLETLLTKKWFHNVLLFLLLVFFSFLSIRNGIFWQGMGGDETLDVYAARTIADDNGPFAEYIILHPPMAYLPTALFILIGRLFSMETLLAVRAGKLVVFLFSTVLVYISANKLTNNRSLALLGAALIGWTSVFTLLAYNSPTKLYVLFFSLVLILFIQYERWFWVGFTTLALVLSWGGGFLYLPLPFIILIFGEWKGAFKRWGLVIGGFLVSALILVLNLYLTDTLALFYAQYIVGTYKLLLGKLGPAVYTYTTVDMGLLVRLTHMSGVDRFILYLSVPAVLSYLHQKFDGHITIKKIRWLVSNTREAPLFLSFVLILTLSLIDFQSFLDAIPVVVPASLLLLLAAKPSLEPSLGKASASNVDLCVRVILIVLVLSVARTIYPVKTSNVSLDAQKTATKLIEEFAPDAEFQYLGHLGQLILRDEENPSRVIHLGPKTMIALEAEGLSLTSYLDEISESDPDFIVVDTRNHELGYLQPVFREMDSTYEFVENPYSNLEYRKVYYQSDNPIGQTLAYSLIVSGQNPDLMEAALAVSDEDVKTALATYREAILANWRVVNFCQSEMGKLRFRQGQPEFAESNFNFVTNTGPFKELGSLALGSFFQSEGEDERAQIYFAGVLGEDIPKSFVYQGPDIFSPTELLKVENSINLGVSKSHYLTGYAFTEADPDHSLFTLWWYLPDRRGARDAMVAFRWIDETGDPIGETEAFRTMFYPELGVRWSYLIEKDVVDKAAGFQVSLVQGDAAPAFGETIDIHRP